MPIPTAAGRWSRIAPPPSRLRPSVLASALCHAGLIALTLATGRRHLPGQPTESGAIELVIQQQQGERPTPASPAAPDATSAASSASPAASLPPPADTPAVPQDKATEPVPARAPAAAEPPPAERQAATAPKAPPAPTFDFSGTDDFNAIAFGPHILPAEPDSRYRNDPPRYPREAGLRGEHGTVVLLIHVSAAGLTTGADVLQSSGYASLDSAAVAAVRTWHFRAAMRDGAPVPFDIPFRFVFEAN